MPTTLAHSPGQHFPQHLCRERAQDGGLISPTSFSGPWQLRALPRPPAPVNEPNRDVDADTARVTGATWETEPTESLSRMIVNDVAGSLCRAGHAQERSPKPVPDSRLECCAWDRRPRQTIERGCMAHIDALVDKVADPALRAALREQVATLLERVC